MQKKLVVVEKRKKNRPKKIDLTPPQLNQVVLFGTTIRYQKTSASDAAVYTNCFAKLICYSTSATTGGVIYEAIRVRKFEAWGLGVTATSGAGGFLTYPQAIAFRFDDASVAPYGREHRVTDVPTSTRSAHIVAKMKGLQAEWMDVNAASAVTGQPFIRISGPIGMIVDVKVTIQLVLNRSSAMPALAGAGLTTRLAYFNYLDNTDTTAAAAGTQFMQAIVGSNSTSFV